MIITQNLIRGASNEYQKNVFKVDGLIQAYVSKSIFYHKIKELDLEKQCFEKVIKWFDKALKIDPDDEILICNKTIVLAELNLYKKAISCIDRVSKNIPNSKTIINCKKLIKEKQEKYASSNKIR